MTRRVRIGLELFGPGVITGILLYLLWGGVHCWKIFVEGQAWEFTPQSLTQAALIMPVAYGFTGIQSIAYTAVIEWRFTRGLDPESWRAVRLSAGLGFLSALVPYGALLLDGNAVAVVVLGGLGLGVGFIMGLLIKRWSAEKKTTGGENP